MRLLILVLIISSSLKANDLVEITNKFQGILLGSVRTNIIEIGKTFEGSGVDAELMFDVLSQQGEQRFCLYIRKQIMNVYKAKGENSCLGELLYEFSINQNWGWAYLPVKYLGRTIMALRFSDKDTKEYFDVRFPNITSEPHKKYQIWDSPSSNYPFGFTIYSIKP